MKFEWLRHIQKIGGSYAVIIPHEIINYWKLSKGLQEIEKIKIIFEDGTVTIEPVANTQECKEFKKPEFKLHQIICYVIYKAGKGLTAREIAEEIKKNRLYVKWQRGKIGEPPTPTYIRARVNKYPHLFTKEEDGKIYLTETGKRVAEEVIKVLVEDRYD